MFAKIISHTQKIELFPQILIAHPSLFATVKPTKSSLGYAYGNGYAVGTALKYFSYTIKIYWLVRFLVSTLFREVLRGNKEHIIVNEDINYIKYRFAIFKCKIFGFLDSIFQKEPRTLNWLIEETNQVVNKI